MADNSIIIYWKSGRVTDVSFPDPLIKDSRMISSEVEFRFDDVTDGLYVNFACHVFIDEPHIDELDGAKAKWKTLYTMRLLGPDDLAEVDSIYFAGQEVISSLDDSQPPISLMKLNRLAELYLDRASSLASYSLIAQVADALATARDLDDDQDGYVSLSDAMGLDSAIIRQARSYAEAMQDEDGVLPGPEPEGAGPGLQATFDDNPEPSPSSAGPSPEPPALHIDFADADGETEGEEWI